MANTLIQFRADDVIKAKAANICEKLGMDLPTYMRICISKLVQENGIPFSMKITEENSGISAMREASRIAEAHGISELSLDEINAEISAVRAERKSKVTEQVGTVK